VITLARPMVQPPSVGWTVTVERGCLKRLIDCKARGNELNFGGDPHAPTHEQLMGGGAGNTPAGAPAPAPEPAPAPGP
jgi:hypothetical protein